MKDGLYQVTTKYLCAGFEMKDNKVVSCAPILVNKIEYWKTIAKYLCDKKVCTSTSSDDLGSDLKSNEPILMNHDSFS